MKTTKETGVYKRMCRGGAFDDCHSANCYAFITAFHIAESNGNTNYDMSITVGVKLGSN